MSFEAEPTVLTLCSYACELQWALGSGVRGEGMPAAVVRAMGERSGADGESWGGESWPTATLLSLIPLKAPQGWLTTE